MLAAKPTFLFRVLRDSSGQRVIPLATIGESGFRETAFTPRGWRAFDLLYLQSGAKLFNSRGGASQGETTMKRGMWEPPSVPLDTLTGCPNVVPRGAAQVPADVRFLTSERRKPLNSVSSLSGAEIEKALRSIPTLMAPAAGVSGAMLARYERQVYVVASGVGKRPTIIAAYDDPVPPPDTLPPGETRPRQIIFVLDEGVYGYRPTLTAVTVGNRGAPPRLQFLDYMDVDNDGRAELFFGLKQPEKNFPGYTRVFRYANDVWREWLRLDGRRCVF